MGLLPRLVAIPLLNLNQNKTYDENDFVCNDIDDWSCIVSVR